MNPYQVLGVSPNASKEEIRSAYLALVKKYHPDRYQDSSLKAQAEEKMKQINAAYDMLTKEPQGSYGGSASTNQSYGGSSAGGQYYGGYSYGGYGYGGSANAGAYSGSYSAEFAKVRSFINSGNIDAAEAVLAAVPLKNAEYWFLLGMCAYRRGRYGSAYECISRACAMAPDNAEYRRVLDNLRGAGSPADRSASSLDASQCCGICSTMLCMNLLCRGFCR